ncbi:MAG: molybdopterin cofactor-binding domain-containing protein [Burkholderiaceae bacterium]
MGKLATVTRRTFLIGSVAVAGGVAFGIWKYRQPYDNPLLEELADGQVALTPYVKIDANGVTIIVPRAEMGQGVHTTLAALVAEELDLDIAAIRVEHGPAAYAYYNAVVLEEGAPFMPTDHSVMAETVRALMRVPAKFLALQVTGGSTSVVDAFEKMRHAGAVARHALMQAAAARLGVAADTLKTEAGAVIAADGRRLPYPELAADAARIDLPASAPLKPREQWKQLGRTLPRVDMLAKVTGTASFGIDARPEGLLYATVRMNPNLGAAMTSFDAGKARAMRGVQQVVALDGGVAVVATNTWYAMQAAAAIEIQWQRANYPQSTEQMFAKVAEAFDDDFRDSRNRDDGDVDAALAQAEVLQAEYRAPYLAHATMEPMNATAWWHDDRLEIWCGTQNPTQSRAEAARISGLPIERIRVHTQYLGGGFGRRSEVDFVAHAVRVAMAVKGRPVKTTWSREEDTTHDMYRPMAIARLRAKVAGGVPVALDARVACASTVASQMGRLGIPVAGPDGTIVQGIWEQPYGIANYRVTGYRAAEMLPVGFWRSVGASQNGFFQESFIDEIAHAAGVDPLAMRLKLITDPVSRKVLETAAELAGWGRALPAGHARGVAFVLSFGVPTAEIIEIAQEQERIRLVRATVVADVGIALDPGNLEAQLISGLNFGLSAAIHSGITVEQGQVQQTNFHNYDAMRMPQAPQIQVRVLQSGGRIRGIGEPGTPPAAPALANAIFALTGKRLREMPFGRFVQFV